MVKTTTRIRGVSFKCLTNEKTPISSYLQKAKLPEDKFNELIQKASEIAKVAGSQAFKNLVREQYVNCVGRNSDTRLSFNVIPAEYAEKLQQLDNATLKAFVILVAETVIGDKIFKDNISAADKQVKGTTKTKKQRTVNKSRKMRAAASKAEQVQKEPVKKEAATTKPEEKAAVTEIDLTAITDKKEYVKALQQVLENELQAMPDSIRGDYEAIRKILSDSHLRTYNISKFSNPNATFTTRERHKILNYVLGKIFANAARYRKLCLNAHGQPQECIVLNPATKDWILIVHYTDGNPSYIAAKYLGKPFNFLHADVMSYGTQEVKKILEELFSKLDSLL